MGNKFSFKWVLLVTVVVLLLLVFYFLNSFQKQPQSDVTSSSSERSFPSSVVKNIGTEYSEIYKDPSDTSGRSVLYDNESELSTRGVGIVVLPDGYTYITGLVKSWETIPNTSDKYLILEDPIGKKILDPVRVVFQKSTLLPNNRTTMIRVENLSTISQSSSIDSGTEEVGFNKEIASLSSENLSTLIHAGDAVTVLPYASYPNNSWKYYYDDKGRFIASVLLLRRTDGVKQILEEIRN